MAMAVLAKLTTLASLHGPRAPPVSGPGSFLTRCKEFPVFVLFPEISEQC
jgi:hypothetical protein